MIYGLRRVVLKSEKMPFTNCAKCGVKGQSKITFYRRHFHLFWIPMFPLAKRGRLECDACGTSTKPKNLPADVENEFVRVKSEARGPLWQFSGILAVSLIIGFSTYSATLYNNNQNEYLNSPAVGDRYQYRLENDLYSLLLVREIMDDTLYLSPNIFEIQKKNKLEQIDKIQNYSKYYYAYTYSEIRNMYDTREIFRILR